MNAVQKPDAARELSRSIYEATQNDEASRVNLWKFLEESKGIWGPDFSADDVMASLEAIATDADASSWTRAQFEDLARLAEACAAADNSRRSTLPEGIRNILAKIAEYIRAVYQTVRHSVPLPKNISDAYETLMFGDSRSEQSSHNAKKRREKRREEVESRFRSRYADAVEDKDSWRGITATNFFPEYKPQITEILLEYPKVEMDNVLLLEGMAEGEMPFRKEFIETQILQEVTGERVILLHRYSDKLLNSIFRLNLKEGSFPDGLIALTEDSRYVEYKAITEPNLIRRLNKSTIADRAFVAVDTLSSETRRKLVSPHTQLNIPEGFEAYILDESTGECWILTNKNKERHIDLLAGRPEHDSRLWNLISTLKPYTTGLDSVKNERLDYSSYQQASPSEVLFQEHGMVPLTALIDSQRTS